jgi:hypothetical protein
MRASLDEADVLPLTGGDGAEDGVARQPGGSSTNSFDNGSDDAAAVAAALASADAAVPPGGSVSLLRVGVWVVQTGVCALPLLGARASAAQHPHARLFAPLTARPPTPALIHAQAPLLNTLDALEDFPDERVSVGVSPGWLSG